MSVIAYHPWARANRRPNISQRALLTHAGLILEPKLDRRTRGGAEQGVLHQADEVFLKSPGPRGPSSGGMVSAVTGSDPIGAAICPPCLHALAPRTGERFPPVDPGTASGCPCL